MRIKLDENNYIVAFALVGDVKGGIDVDIDVEVFEDYPCELFKYENETVVLDKDKKSEWLKQQYIEDKKLQLQEQIDEIMLWFEYYDECYREYERCKRFGIDYEEDIEELNRQAKERQENLSKLRTQLKELE